VQTIIRMPKDLLSGLKKRAFLEDKSLAQFMRELSEFYLLEKAKKDEFNPKDAIWQLPKRAVKTGKINLANRIDEIVYGK